MLFPISEALLVENIPNIGHFLWLTGHKAYMVGLFGGIITMSTFVSFYLFFFVILLLKVYIFIKVYKNEADNCYLAQKFSLVVLEIRLTVVIWAKIEVYNTETWYMDFVQLFSG